MKSPQKSPSAGLFAVAIALLLTQIAYAAAQMTSLLLSRQFWVADLANFIRPHLLLIGVALFVLGMVLPRRTTRIGGLVSLLAAILPYTLLPHLHPISADGRSRWFQRMCSWTTKIRTRSSPFPRSRPPTSSSFRK